MQYDSNHNNDKHPYFKSNSLREHNYHCINSYIEALLQEANFIIIQIDNGNIENSRENRNHATWRLKRVEKNIKESTNKNNRLMLNSLWSQLYRLEHAKGDTHPLIERIRQLHSI